MLGSDVAVRYDDIGNRLKAFRLHHRLNAEDIARQTGKGRDAARSLSGLLGQIAPQAAAAPASAAASPAAR